MYGFDKRDYFGRESLRMLRAEFKSTPGMQALVDETEAKLAKMGILLAKYDRDRAKEARELSRATRRKAR